MNDYPQGGDLMQRKKAFRFAKPAAKRKKRSAEVTFRLHALRIAFLMLFPGALPWFCRHMAK